MKQLERLLQEQNKYNNNQINQWEDNSSAIQIEVRSVHKELKNTNEELNNQKQFFITYWETANDEIINEKWNEYEIINI